MHEWLTALATDTSNDLLGYIQNIMPAVLSVVALVLGVSLLIALFRWLVNKL